MAPKGQRWNPPRASPSTQGLTQQPVKREGAAESSEARPLRFFEKREAKPSQRYGQIWRWKHALWSESGGLHA